MSTLDVCALCPRLCRAACPVAEGTSREAATPTRLAEVVRAWQLGQVNDDLAWEAATLCVDCGACTDLCHLHAPLPEALSSARATMRPPDVEPLRPIEGDAVRVLIVPQGAEGLAGALGGAVALWRTKDALGAALAGTVAAAERLGQVREAAAGRELLVVDGATARWLDRADVPYRWLSDVAGATVSPSCAAGCGGRVRCCGGADPLNSQHPEDARRMAARWVDEHKPEVVGDLRCARWLAACGYSIPLWAGESP